MSGCLRRLRLVSVTRISNGCGQESHETQLLNVHGPETFFIIHPPFINHHPPWAPTRQLTGDEAFCDLASFRLKLFFIIHPPFFNHNQGLWQC